MAVARAFFKRDLSMALSYRLSFIMQIAGIFFSMALFYFLSLLFGNTLVPQLEQYGGDYFSFVLIGLAFSGYMGLSLSSFAQSIREGQTMGTLEIMLLSPTRLSAIRMSSSLWPYMRQLAEDIHRLASLEAVFSTLVNPTDVLSGAFEKAFDIRSIGTCVEVPQLKTWLCHNLKAEYDDIRLEQ